MNKISLVLAVVIILLISLSCQKNENIIAFKKRKLDVWHIQNSELISVGGKEISKPNYDIENWYTAQVPETVLACLERNGVYKDIFRDDNLEKIPVDQFKSPWWYRTEFNVDKISLGLLLDFDGINYKANIWLNGTQIADTTDVINSFRQFKFNISKTAQKEKNVLAVEVFPPKAGDFSIGFVDWNPVPPDKNMGIFREVFLEANEGVGILDPYIATSLTKDLSKATIHASVVLTNYTDKDQSGKVDLIIDTNKLSKSVTLKPGERKKILFNSLTISNPKLWWPHTLGKPHLYSATFEFNKEKRTFDSKTIDFGIRTVSKYFTGNGALGYKINGKKILIRGGGWVDRLLLNDTYESVKAQLEYVKDMNLNTVRLEGFWGNSKDMYELCDSLGILIMVGYSCQWEWPHYLGKPTDEKYGGIVSDDDIDLMSDAWRDQIVWLRNHPSIISWVAGSDLIPKPELEKKYFEIFKEYDSTRVFLASAKNATTLNGSTGVKMEGPYAYVPPVYWYSDTIKGGAYGFNTETGPGAQVPPLQSLKKMLSPEHLWPIDSLWNYHCGRFEFGTLRRYNKAMNKRYGEPADLDEYLKKAQVLNYELMRPMFEAFSAYRDQATGVIQWMLNSAWPEMYWQLYDYYLMPNAAYYSAKLAQRPYHVIYDYYQKSLFVANDRLEDLNGCEIKVRVYDTNSNLKFERTISNIDLKANSSKEIMSLKNLDISSVLFIDTRLYDKSKKEIDNNFYWISPKADILDYEDKTEAWYVTTPSKQYADFTEINNMPKVKVDSKMSVKKGKEKTTFEVTIENNNDKIAFFFYADIIDEKTGEIIIPVIWSDNYISLLPGEKRVLIAEINNILLKDKTIKYSVKGYNLKETE